MHTYPNRKLVAVGSSLLVARELAGLLRTLLGNLLPIETCKTSDIQRSESNAFYICANTQGERLSLCVPQEQLFILALEPQATFFLSLAQVPMHSSVVVFNNLRPYAELLIRRCKERGLTDFQYTPLAYEELPIEETGAILQRAHAIIGVDVFVCDGVLGSPRYRSYLRDDVIVIGGQRVPSVASAASLLLAIARRVEDILSAIPSDQLDPVQLLQWNDGIRQAILELIILQMRKTDEPKHTTPVSVNGFSIHPNLDEEKKKLSYLIAQLESLRRDIVV